MLQEPPPLAGGPSHVADWQTNLADGDDDQMTVSFTVGKGAIHPKLEPKLEIFDVIQGSNHHKGMNVSLARRLLACWFVTMLTIRGTRQWLWYVWRSLTCPFHLH